VDTLARAKELGFRLAVASSSKQVHLDSKIDRFGFGPHVLPHVYSAEHVTSGKPAPDIFLYAAERLSAEPDACLVIEDSPFGVEAGVAAGMETWGFLGGGHCLHDHTARLKAAGATRVLATHAALQQELARVMTEQIQ
jgi:beta-phosphoglucomutase-like phosphatase (HAD superfamily)